MSQELLSPGEMRALSLKEQGDLRRVRRRICGEFRPVVTDPAQAILIDELIEVAQMTVGMKAERQSVRKALMHIGSAVGLHETHAAWQELAAAALLMADSLRPRQVHGSRQR